MIMETSHRESRSSAQQAAAPESSRDLKSLISGLADDASRWIRQETELAKEELSRKAHELTQNLSQLAAGAFGIAIGAALLLFAFSIGIAALIQLTGLSALTSGFLGFLSMGILVATVGTIIFLHSKKKLSAENLKPQRTADSLLETKNWAKSKIQ